MKNKSTTRELPIELLQTPPSTARDKLVARLVAGYYHDFKTELDTPKVTLYKELLALKLQILADAVKNGEYDEEPDPDDLEQLAQDLHAHGQKDGARAVHTVADAIRLKQESDARKTENHFEPTQELNKNLVVPHVECRFHIYSWTPEPDGKGKPTQVHLVMEVPDIQEMKFVVRFKSKEAINEFIGRMREFRDEVWPHS